MDKKKKLLFIISSLKVWGGAENSSRILANSFKKLWYDITLLTFYNHKNEYSVDWVKRVVIWDRYSINIFTKFYRFFFKYPIFINKIIKKNKYDLVITNSEDWNLVWLNVKKYINKSIKLIVVVRNYIRRHFVYKHTIPYHKNANHIVTISKHLWSMFNWIVSKNKITTIYNPFDVDRIKELAKEEIHNNFEKIFQNNTNIISVWRLSPQKDYSFMIRSLAPLLKKTNKLKWLILWDWELKEKLKNEINREWINDKVIFLWVKDNPFKYIYNSDIFAFWSDHEWFGRVIVESMASSTPVVSVNCPSWPSEILGNKAYKKDLVKWYEELDYWILVEQHNEEAFRNSIKYIIDKKVNFDVSKKLKEFNIKHIAKQRENLIDIVLSK